MLFLLLCASVFCNEGRDHHDDRASTPPGQVAKADSTRTPVPTPGNSAQSSPVVTPGRPDQLLNEDQNADFLPTLDKRFSEVARVIAELSRDDILRLRKGIGIASDACLRQLDVAPAVES